MTQVLLGIGIAIAAVAAVVLMFVTVAVGWSLANWLYQRTEAWLNEHWS